jgi:histidinol-phosphate/aromatic aminotransferase/cobyric acid decarboxylase-like protein
LTNPNAPRGNIISIEAISKVPEKNKDASELNKGEIV